MTNGAMSLLRQDQPFEQFTGRLRVSGPWITDKEISYVTEAVKERVV